MPKLYFASGSNIDDFFIIPTIRLHKTYHVVYG